MATTLVKQDGVYRQADAYAAGVAYAAGAARLLVAANDNMTEPLCRQTYDLERSLARWRERAHA